MHFYVFSFPCRLFSAKGDFWTSECTFFFSFFCFPLFLFFFLLVKQQSKSLCLYAFAKHTNVWPVCYWITSWAYVLAPSLVIISSLSKGFYKQMHISKSVHQHNHSLKPPFAKTTILGMHFKDTASMRLFMQRNTLVLHQDQNKIFFS